MDIGILIRRARTEKGYTQEKLAELVGVKKSAVAKWENGRVSEIKRSNLKRLSEALGLNPNDLVGSESQNEKPPDNSGLSERKKAFIEVVKQMSDAELDRLDQILRIVEGKK